MKNLNLTLIFLVMLAIGQATAQELPKGTHWTVIESKGVKVHTYMSPGVMFANTSHVIELKDELIIVDGQFFAPYAQELKAITDSLKKPISRFYISHDHPDHYIGFGDAFPEVPVYALAETKEAIERDGPSVLSQRQAQFGPMIAKNLKAPTVVQAPGTEKIGRTKFIFEKSVDNEAAVSLVIKIPALGVYVAQDLVYNQTHLFISGDTKGWERALQSIIDQKRYDLVLSGHGKEGGASLVRDNLAYLAFVNQAILESKNQAEFKARIMEKYPHFAGEQLIDIYLNYYLKPKNWE